MYVYRVETITKRSIQNRLNPNTFDDFAHRQEIINWRACLKFPEEPKVSDAAKDLICRLLCDVESRLGTRGVEEIKAHPWFEGTKWDALYEMNAAYKLIVTGELDTQNFEKFTK
ncbi:hypothetical protein H5410_015834, partial [Solanum commersonii]